MTGPQIADPTDKKQLIYAAAKALAGLPTDVFIGIASAQTSKFVQIARRIYKQQDYDYQFSDDDLRSIHDCVRMMATARMAQAPVELQ